MEHGLRKSSECHWVMQVGDVRCSSDSGVKADIAAGLTCAKRRPEQVQQTERLTRSPRRREVEV